MSVSERTHTAPRRFVLFACRSTYAAEMAEIVWRLGAEVDALVDNMPDGPEVPALGRTMVPSELTARERALPTVIPLTTPAYRAMVEQQARALGFTWFPALVDPSAVVARTAVLGEGVSVNALAVIGARSRLGRFALVNRSASVGHDTELHDFTTFGPACVVAAHVVVESGVFVGAGAVLGPKVRIGANAIVGAGAVVMRDVPAFVTVVGNPARVIRESTTGYGGGVVAADALTVQAEARR
jgi:sugar O-acyltransferase (sialic acid O-acetyltransferase NeuD family)